jgi:hypothetical protein
LIQHFRRVVSYTVAGLLVLVCLIGFADFAVRGLSLSSLEEAGYGDSYILHDVIHFQKSGVIYRDLAEPPFLPAQYSPLVYILYSLPGHFVHSENPFFAPRLIAIAAVLASIGLITSIVRALFPGVVWLWGFLLPFSIREIPSWILQLRGDLPGISLSLLSIRLLLSESRWAVPLAAICGGLAVQMKFTFVSAASAGVVWLVVQRRWRDAARFLVLFAIASLGPYLLYSLREPGMISQMLTLSPGIRDLTGNLGLISQVFKELVISLTLVGLASIEWRAQAKEMLLVLYLAASFMVGALTAVQAGANTNYYLEMLYASIPIAVVGVLRLIELAKRPTGLGPALAVFLLIQFLGPAWIRVRDDVAVLRTGRVESGNNDIRDLSQVLTGSRIFSSVPRLALLDSNPSLTEPYLLSYLHRLGKLELKPFTDPLRRNEYDVVITYQFQFSYRNVAQLDPELRDAIAGSYKPYCTFHQALFHLPALVDASTSSLAARLKTMGCSPVTEEAGKVW